MLSTVLTRYLRRSSAARALDLRAAQPLFDSTWYVANYADIAADGCDPWQHYIAQGVSEGRDPNPLFDNTWYLQRYADVRHAGIPPLLHYWAHGATNGYDPNPLFDSAWYLRRNRDVRLAGINPLQHYLQYGAAQGRDTSARFSSAWYMRVNPDVDASKLTPLGHYLRYGCDEGRSHFPYHRNGRSSMRLAGRLFNALNRRNKSSRRIAVYTAIYDNYDALQIPAVVDPNCDYYCFTDADIGWQDIWIRREPIWRHADPARTVRHLKLHPHLYFADYDWSVWLDGNLRLAASPQALFPSTEFDIAVWRHPYRDCIYHEAETCVQCGKDEPSTIRAQMARYRLSAYPEHAGLTENNVLVRRHHAPTVVDLGEAWWREIVAGSRRDQLSFNYVARSSAARIAFLGAPGISARNDPRIRFFSHIRRTPSAHR